MRTEVITNYVADDGTAFPDEHKCLLYEGHCRKLAAIIEPLGLAPDDCEFANGEGWIQHDRHVVIDIVKNLLIFARDELYIRHNWVDKMLEDPTKMHSGWVGRLIDDNGHKALYAAWARVMCINVESCREYGQPYFAANPKEAHGKEIKRRSRA